jgi:hypothetical protein
MSQEPVFKITENLFQKLVEKYEAKEEEIIDEEEGIQSVDCNNLDLKDETQESKPINTDS